MELQALPWTRALPEGDAHEGGPCPIPLEGGKFGGHNILSLGQGRKMVFSLFLEKQLEKRLSQDTKKRIGLRFVRQVAAFCGESLLFIGPSLRVLHSGN